MSEHEKHVCQVLQYLVENCLYVKGEKCVFHIQSVSFLGLVVEKSHLWGDPGKIKAVVTRSPEWRTDPKVSRLC